MLLLVRTTTHLSMTVKHDKINQKKPLSPRSSAPGVRRWAHSAAEAASTAPASIASGIQDDPWESLDRSWAITQACQAMVWLSVSPATAPCARRAANASCEAPAEAMRRRVPRHTGSAVVAPVHQDEHVAESCEAARLRNSHGAAYAPAARQFTRNRRGLNVKQVWRKKTCGNPHEWNKMTGRPEST